MSKCDTTLVSITGIAIEKAALRKFEASLQGDVIHPGEERYHLARRSWNGELDPRRPGMIARCTSTIDVVRCVDFARSNELSIAVRAGGHSFAGDSFCDGGMVIDVSPMKMIRVDRERRVAHAGAGLTVGEFDQTTVPMGLATVLGECNAVGIAGYTLGGGLGRLMGQHGAGCDNLIAAELVTAEGEVSRLSADENADLFWAVRGGGGNFGIVTSFEYQLHPVGQVVSGTLTYPISDLRIVLTFLDEYVNRVPDEVDIVIDIGNPGWVAGAGIAEPTVNVTVSYCGDVRKGEAALRPFRSFRRPIADGIRVMPYLEMQGLFDIRPLVEFGLSGGSTALEGGFIERVGKQAIDIIQAFVAEAPACFWITAEHYLHGAVLHPETDGTAFALRRPGYTTRFFSAWREPELADASITWVKRLGATLKTVAGDASYLNYLSKGASDADTRAAYGEHYERLAALKSKHDRSNFFSSNRNIQPVKH